MEERKKDVLYMALQHGVTMCGIVQCLLIHFNTLIFNIAPNHSSSCFKAFYIVR